MFSDCFEGAVKNIERKIGSQDFQKERCGELELLAHRRGFLSEGVSCRPLIHVKQLIKE